MSLHTRLSVNEEELSAKVIDGEAIIINFSNGIYYSLDGVGGVVWEMIERGYTVEEMITAISAHYEVSPETVKLDLERLERELVEENLVKVSNQKSPKEETQKWEGQQNGSYDSPKLNIYRDMGQLLALDPPMPGLHEMTWKEPEVDSTV